ncbi:MAG: hypothetical protein HN457_08435 [Opitutales bacterium]|nr:hypothetical protein [Opitutales bacterium]
MTAPGSTIVRIALCSVLLLAFVANAQRVVNSSLNVPLEIDELPQLLSETGIFKDLQTLEPEAGIIPYEPNLSFWSDNAIKSRWVYIPNDEQVAYSLDRDWRFPTGSIWVKHFDLELERGDSESRRRIETRLLVKIAFGVYGVSYLWNKEGTDATLVREESVPLTYDIVDGGVAREQQWSIPSRDECIQCHVFAGGMALSFNTRQLNRELEIEGEMVNFIKYLGDIGILDTKIETPEILPRYSSAGDTSYCIDHQARSYLAVNCSYCHSPSGGLEANPFDVRPNRALDFTGLIDGAVNFDYEDPLVNLVTRGSHDLSALWLNMTGTSTLERMPPLATFERDLEGEELIKRWINEYLPDYLSFDEWRAQHFVDPNAAEAAKNSDADGDGESNRLEYVGRTDPNDAHDHSFFEASKDGGLLRLSFNATPFSEYQLEASEDLVNWNLFESESNPVRMLPEGAEQIEVALPIDEIEVSTPFLRVKVRER